jgi:hypothetical protein
MWTADHEHLAVGAVLAVCETGVVRRRPVDVPGWDSDAVVVDDRYIERVPRRVAARRGLEQECRILPVIAPLLPLAVPVPTEVAPDRFGPWRVRHEMLPGAAVEPGRLTGADGVAVTTFCVRCTTCPRRPSLKRPWPVEQDL